jgi:hypothetical protein
MANRISTKVKLMSHLFYVFGHEFRQEALKVLDVLACHETIHKHVIVFGERYVVGVIAFKTR